MAEFRIKYIEKVRENILGVDDKEIERASKLLNEAGSILIYGAGRSFLALKIGLGQISNFKVFSCPKDAGFPGIDGLIERHGKIAVLLASGSGTTETTLEALNDIIKEKGKKIWIR